MMNLMEAGAVYEEQCRVLSNLDIDDITMNQPATFFVANNGCNTYYNAHKVIGSISMDMSAEASAYVRHCMSCDIPLTHV